MPEGTVALIAPGIVHLGWPGAQEGWRYRMLYPAEDIVRETVTDVFGASTLATFDRPVVEDPPLYARLMRLHVASESPHVDALELGALYVDAIGHAFGNHAGRRLPADTAIHKRGMRVVHEAIEACYAEPLTLERLARLAGMSKFHLLRQFKLTYGLPPHAYLRQVRVERARRLILAGGDLAHAATTVGFADQAHMTRIFRRTLGYTPGALTAT
jgi:AraC-like DNA-binding protein